MPKMTPLLLQVDHHRGVLLQKSYIKRKVIAKIVLEVVALVVEVLLVIIGRTVLIAATIVILV